MHAFLFSRGMKLTHNGSTRKSSAKTPHTPPESDEADQGGANAWEPAQGGASVWEPAVVVPTGPRNQNSRWPRQNGFKQPYKKHVWPKNRDMKPRKTDSDTDEDGGVVFKANDNRDPEYDIKQLVDWKGDWLPPPEDWAARNPHVNQNFGKWVEQWINGHPSVCTKPLDISGQAFTGESKNEGEDDEDQSNAHRDCKEMVPQYWMAIQIEGKPLGQFWKELPSRAPTISDIDFGAESPWWERYEAGETSCLPTLAVPDAKIDFEAFENHTNPLGFASTNEKIAHAKAKHDERVRKTRERRARPLPEPMVIVPAVENRTIQSTTDLYLRPVQDSDVRGITEIYNYYVEHSIHTAEFDARTEEQFKARVDDVVEAGLPYIVAVARGNYPRKEGEGEKILGWVCLDDYCHPGTSYRYTLSAQLMVHPGFTRKNIAKSLLDCLLDMTNTEYKKRGGYDYVNKFDYLKHGPTRVIKTMLLNFHFPRGQDVSWANEFMDDFGFVRAGKISYIGYKHDNVLDMNIYQHHTPEIISAHGLPIARL